MNCVLLGRVVDVFEKEFEGKDKSTVKYGVVSVIDEDAYMDSDRIFAIRVSKVELVKKVEQGQSYKFKGNLTTDRGVLKFKVKDIEPAK